MLVPIMGLWALPYFTHVIMWLRLYYVEVNDVLGLMHLHFLSLVLSLRMVLFVNPAQLEVQFCDRAVLSTISEAKFHQVKKMFWLMASRSNPILSVFLLESLA